MKRDDARKHCNDAMGECEVQLEKSHGQQSDETEMLRRRRIAEISSDMTNRETLEAQYGKVWSTEEMVKEFAAIGFMAPYVVVRRRSDGVKGTLEFCHSPRFYFSFSPHK
jgi:hypothetical protein